jgi:hypothetical protein
VLDATALRQTVQSAAGKILPTVPRLPGLHPRESSATWSARCRRSSRSSSNRITEHHTSLQPVGMQSALHEAADRIAEEVYWRRSRQSRTSSITDALSKMSAAQVGQ